MMTPTKNTNRILKSSKEKAVKGRTFRAAHYEGADMIQHAKTLCQEESGFSLIELIIYIVLLALLMGVVFISFLPVFRTNTQQWKQSETKLETGIGLDLLRTDLEGAGFGLPWNFPTGVVPNPYQEPAPLADTPGVPRALNSEDNSASSLNASDYLVIRGSIMARGVSSQKWGWLGRDVNHIPSIQSMSDDAFTGTDRVIVIDPQDRELVLNGASYFDRPTAAGMQLYSPPVSAQDPLGQRYLLYGIDDIDPIRPFNRTDYYINNVNVNHCAPGTGTLVKATVNQANNNFVTLPLVDCAADFQVVYYLDTDGDGGWDTRANASALNGLDPSDIRQQVKFIRCYVLTHEGGSDDTFTYPNVNINVGEVDAGGVNLVDINAGRAFDLNANIGPTWANYRWKVYSLAVTPKNLK